MPRQVFISYAHADDLPFDDGAPGWVTFFVDKLKRAVARQPGGADFEFWMDFRLEPQRRVDQELRRRIRESAVILALISPRYLESSWCQDEMRTFVEEVGEGVSADRVFLVEVLPTSRGDWHEAIRELAAITFWSSSLARPEPKTYGWPLPNVRSDREYWDEVNSLASILARQLRALGPSTAAHPSRTPAPALPPVQAPPSGPADRLEGPLSILISADSADSALALEAQAGLGAFDVDAMVAAQPAADQLPASYREQFEATLRNSHGVIVVYGEAPPTWVQAKFGELRKVLALERKGTWAGLLEGPPPGKPGHGLPPRNLMLLNCRQGLNQAELGRFVAALRASLGGAGPAPRHV